MVPIDGLVFIAIAAIVLFAFGFIANIREEPSFGAMEEKDKTAFLDYHPISGDYFDGRIQLLPDKLSFIDNSGKEKFSINYDNISKCRLGYSRIAMVTGGNGYHYLYLYKRGESAVFVTFRFRSRAWPYVKDLNSKIEQKLRT